MALFIFYWKVEVLKLSCVEFVIIITILQLNSTFLSKMDNTLGVSEFVELKEASTSSQDFYFNRETTVALIHLYKIYRPQVGFGGIKTIKKLWEVISGELSESFKLTIGPTKCENRFKVLERNYKKSMVINNSRRRRKRFEFEEEFADLYGSEVNIMPIILLDNNKTNLPNETKENLNQFSISLEASTSEHATNELAAPNDDTTEVVITKPERRSRKTIPDQKKRSRATPRYGEPSKRQIDLLMEIKNDLKKYFNDKISIEKEKLQLKREILEQKKRRIRLLERQFQFQ